MRPTRTVLRLLCGEPLVHSPVPRDAVESGGQGRLQGRLRMRRQYGGSGLAPSRAGSPGLLSLRPTREARRVLATLSLTVTVSYGVLVYAYPVLLRPMERDLGWSRGQTSAA